MSYTRVRPVASTDVRPFHMSSCSRRRKDDRTSLILLARKSGALQACRLICSRREISAVTSTGSNSGILVLSTHLLNFAAVKTVKWLSPLKFLLIVYRNSFILFLLCFVSLSYVRSQFSSFSVCRYFLRFGHLSLRFVKDFLNRDSR